jgi:hypothetical protein
LSVLSRRSGRCCPFIVYIIPDNAGKVNTFFVKSLQTVCLLCALVVVVFPHRHTSIVPD